MSQNIIFLKNKDTLLENLDLCDKSSLLLDDEGVSLLRHEGSNVSTQSTSDGSEDEDSLISIKETKKSMVIKHVLQKQ